MVIFVAGRQGIPEEYYEAASIDGATPWQQFRNVTLPLLAPTTMFVLVTSVIGAFQAFDQIYVMTDGGPLYSTETLVIYMYRYASRISRSGMGAPSPSVCLRSSWSSPSSRCGCSAIPNSRCTDMVSHASPDRGGAVDVWRTQFVRRGSRALMRLTLVAGAIVFVFPFVWMLAMSVKPRGRRLRTRRPCCHAHSTSRRIEVSGRRSPWDSFTSTLLSLPER